MTGQERLYNQIQKATLDNFPRTLMLIGARGSGKHTLVSHLSNHFNLEIEDISDALNLETITNITQRVSPKIYVIDSSKLTIKNENVILKFLEEPLKNSYIVVLAESKRSIIPTVLNRCQLWELNIYEKDFLKTFITSNDIEEETLLNIADTPGKIIEYQHYPIKEMFALAEKIFNNITNANFANVLSLSRFIAFKNEKDKFDFNLFVDILQLVSTSVYRRGIKQGYEIYKLTNELSNSKYIFNIDKKSLFDNYLISLKMIMST